MFEIIAAGISEIDLRLARSLHSSHLRSPCRGPLESGSHGVALRQTEIERC